MSYGLLMRNDSDEVVIDGEHPLLSLVSMTEKSISASKLSGPADQEWHYRESVITLPHYGAQDIVPFFCLSHGMKIGVTGVKRTSSHIEIGVVAKAGGVLRVELYSYADFAITTQGNYGLQVFSSASQLVYDSRNPPLRPRAFAQGNFDLSLPAVAGQPYGVSGDVLMKFVQVRIEEGSTGNYHQYWDYRCTAWLSWQSGRLQLDAPQYESMNQYELEDTYCFNYGMGYWAEPPGDYIGPGVTYNWHILNGGPATLGATVAYSYDGVDF